MRAAAPMPLSGPWRPGLAGVGAALASWALVGCGTQGAQPVTGENRVGDAVCVACHAEKADYEQTAHRLSSAHPGAVTVHGSFRDGENTMITVNPHLHFRMEARADGFYQAAIREAGATTLTTEERIGLVIGSGRKGQTYLYWRGDELYQLPVSYWRDPGGWVNSPRYVDGTADFGRPANPRCLECHSTYAEALPGERRNRYAPASLVVGISCETCHGGGADHVARHGSRFGAWRGQAIANPARLSRRAQLDLCGLCHGGVGEPLTRSFGYAPGRSLAEYVRQPLPLPGEPPDVHGNQVALLARSACFQRSQMTCSTCHDPHRTQRDPVALGSACLSCHQATSCGLFPEHGDALAERCVHCHMPALPSTTIISSHDGGRVQPLVRSHWIRVYGPEPR